MTNCLKKKTFNAMFNKLEEKQLEVPPTTAANIGCLQLFNELNAKQLPAKV